MSDTMSRFRDALDAVAEHTGDYQGIPVALDADTPLILHRSHPLADLFEYTHWDAPRDGDAEPEDAAGVVERDPDETVTFTCSGVSDTERVVNHWWDMARNREVFVLDTDGVRYALTVPISPDRSMERLNMWFTAIGATDAWRIEAEHTARAALRELLTERQWRHYDLTGAFIETSPRSRVTYLLRRLRPTIAMTPRDRWTGREETMRVLTVLCLHPTGYYGGTWAGCLTPTDDVLAHLLMIRGDEARYWAKANHHRPSEPEAGI